MIVVGLRFRVAISALKHRIIRRIGVTGSAHTICISMVRREPGVIESRIQPVRGGVAGVASCREPRRRMVRIGCALIVRLVARIASCRHRRVVIVHMAVRARCCSVRSC